MSEEPGCTHVIGSDRIVGFCPFCRTAAAEVEAASLRARLASCEGRLAEAAAGMEQAVRERDEARAAAMELTLRSRLGAYRELAAKHADALHELNVLRFTQDAIRAERDAARATEAENRAATAETLRLAVIASRGRAENERDAAIARAEAAERQNAQWATQGQELTAALIAVSSALGEGQDESVTLLDVHERVRAMREERDTERAAREKAEAALAEMRQTFAPIIADTKPWHYDSGYYVCPSCDGTIRNHTTDHELGCRWLAASRLLDAPDAGSALLAERDRERAALAAIACRPNQHATSNAPCCTARAGLMGTGGSALIAELRARRKVCEAAAEMAAWDWTHLLVDHPDADDVRADAKRLDAALAAVPKETA